MKNKLTKLVTCLFLMIGCTSSFAQDITIPKQKVNEELRAKLPAKNLESGKLISVNGGSFPPYIIAKSNTDIDGASEDFSQAISELLGLKIEHLTVSGLAAELSGVNSGRYDLSIGPVGDYPSRQGANDFIDYVQEFVVFAVKKGNPENITNLGETCGKRISVMAAGSAEKVIKQQSEVCIKDGKPAVNVLSFADQPTAILSVRSNRADAFFSSQAPLTYFVQQANGQLELAGIGQKNGFEDIYQGAVVAKNSPLGNVLKSAFNELIANGTYEIIMKKWGLENNMVKSVDVNMATDMSK
ncbi:MULTISPECIES: ABC transporter substrate-binding protein [Bartonella]|uniref:Amino acid ABC transporter substrate-binding protein, PAAT family n=1 Tax=Bartonella choladocola TaxID=2750995 RepID=A0A1U9MGX0_9HYPH|nr:MULTISPECIES: ABC transporter substrate-binding protein [Bartonella]AQT46922.1 amino acid ABC transporter substrate-binding protein, PAAT family [Bartonella choladocola]OLY47911.1 polar amino acid transport system substrate-binding protein [Bartonella apis]